MARKVEEKVEEREIPGQPSATSLWLLRLTGATSSKVGVTYMWRYYTEPRFRVRMDAEAYAVLVGAGADLSECVIILWLVHDIQYYEAVKALRDALIASK